MLKCKNWSFSDPTPYPTLANKELVALPAEKGGSIIIFPHSFYISSLTSMLDNNAYEKISLSDPKSDLKVCIDLRKLIKEKSILWNLKPEELKYIICKTGKLPKLRGNPKFHKLTPPFPLKKLSFRPIIVVTDPSVEHGG